MGITFGEWLQDYYTYKSKRVKPSTLRNISIVIRCHVPEWLKACPLSDLTYRDLEHIIYDVASSRMRKYTEQVLNEALERAVRLEELPRNPMAGADRVKHRQRRGRALTRAERQVLQDTVHPQELNLLFQFYMYTGCRRSEALALTWDDIDELGNQLYIHGTKTEDSERILPMSRPLRRIVEQIPYRKGRKLFDYSPDYVTKQFKKYCPGHKLHDLRHTFATICLESGVSLKVVSQWLGHTSIDITARIYMHVLDEYQRKEAEKLC